MGYSLFVRGAPADMSTDDSQLWFPLLAMPALRKAMGEYGMLDGQGIPRAKLTGNDGHKIPARQIKRALAIYLRAGEPLPAFCLPPYEDGWDEGAVSLWWSWIAILERAAAYDGLEVW